MGILTVPWARFHWVVDAARVVGKSFLCTSAFPYSNGLISYSTAGHVWTKTVSQLQRRVPVPQTLPSICFSLVGKRFGVDVCLSSNTCSTCNFDVESHIKYSTVGESVHSNVARAFLL